MPAELHFLNVKDGDCSWIKHPNGHNTIIDVFNASIEKQKELDAKTKLLNALQINESIKTNGIKGNFRQKEYPVNPIEYLKSFNVNSIFRFIVTHPDMDHIGGIKDFFESFSPINIWDTDNKKEMESFEGSPYNEDDWKFYKNIRDGKNTNQKRLTLFSGSEGKYYNLNEDGSCCGNGLFIRATTPELLKAAIEADDYNDASYVISYRPLNSAHVIFAGDSHDKTWEHILNKWKNDVENCDILIAPHHGRGSKRSYEFLDTLKPKITFFGNAKNENLEYDAWNTRNLEKFTNNQGNCLIAKFLDTGTEIRCTYQKFAENYCEEMGYKTSLDYDTKSYYLKTL
jgi:competence protein ComEC